MDRRNFIAGLTALTVAMDNTHRLLSQPSGNIIKPEVLKTGDIVGIIAPGTAVSDPEDHLKVKEVMDYFGLEYRLSKNLIKGTGYKSRSVQERLDDFHEMFSDNTISAVFCIRGGYGSIQILDGINYNLVKNNPKIFVGYSDITALHLAINKMTGLITFHGPVMLSSFSAFTVDYFNKALFSTQGIGKIENTVIKNSVRTLNPQRTIVPGIAKGALAGGNLSIICSLIGTKFDIDTKGKILFLEDVDEEPYRIDRMLTQLKLAGKLEESAGIIFGKCSNCTPSRFEPSLSWDYSLGEVLDNILGKLNKPSYYGLMFGHTSDQVTLPVGINAEMDAEKCTLLINESAVI